MSNRDFREVGPLDKEVLKQCYKMKMEIKSIRQRREKIKKEIRRLENERYSDTVKGSKGEWNIYGPIKINGIPNKILSKKIKSLQRYDHILEVHELELLDLTIQAEEFIDNLEDGELRSMFRLYYIDDLPWWKVAQEMNDIFPKRTKKFTEDSCRMRNKRFFEEN